MLKQTIPKYTVVVGRKDSDQNDDCLIRTETDVSDDELEITLNFSDITRSNQPKWANYVKGVLQYFPSKVKQKKLI